jgi:hypothetical protein
MTPGRAQNEVGAPVNATTVKWVVVGVVALVFLGIFKDEIGGLINRTSGIEWKGIKVETPIGQTTVSVQKAPETQYADAFKFRSNTHVDTNYKFAISWPEGSNWVPSDKMSKSQLSSLSLDDLGVTFFLVNFVSDSSQEAAVSVKALPRQFASIQSAVDSYVQSQLGVGNTILSSTADPTSGGALVVISHKGRKGVNRILLGDTYMYLIGSIAMAPNPEGDVSPKLAEETNAIFNSFRILY